MGNNRGFDDGGMFLKSIFDFGWRDEDAAALKTVVTPAGDEEITLIVFLGEIAGEVPAVTNNRFGSSLVFVVTEK